jgi:hypothetical protein
LALLTSKQFLPGSRPDPIKFSRRTRPSPATGRRWLTMSAATAALPRTGLNGTEHRWHRLLWQKPLAPAARLLLTARYTLRSLSYSVDSRDCIGVVPLIAAMAWQAQSIDACMPAASEIRNASMIAAWLFPTRRASWMWVVMPRTKR